MTTSSRRPQFLARSGPKTVKQASFRQVPTRGGQQVRVFSAPAFEPPPPPKAPEAPAAVQDVAPGAAAEEQLRADIAQRVGTAVDLLRSTAEQLATEARSDAMEVGFLVARRILESELTTSPETMVALVRSAIRRLGEARKIVVRLSPLDAVAVDAMLAERSPTAVAPLATAQIEVIADTTLERGDCLVEGDLGTVDGRIATRLEELRRSLADESLEVES
jgi:flagellar assembly protein FliH